MENFSQQSLALVPNTGYPYHPFLQQQLQQQQQEEQMQIFWDQKLEEIKQLRDLKHLEFPISRTRRIMKANPNVQKVSGESPILFAKACEFLVEELTLRSWLHTEGNDRQLLQKKDIADAVRETKVFDFLAKIVLRDEVNEGATGFGPGMVGSTVSGVPNYYPVGQPAMPGVIIGNPAIHVVEGATGFGPVMVGSTVSGVPNYYPVGQSAMPGVIIGNPAIHVVAPPVYVQPWVQVWQPVENNPYATGGNDGQGNLGPQS